MIMRLLDEIRKFFRWVRFGKIREKILSIENGHAAEIEIRGRFNEVIGYWAYGYYDPSLPYQGPHQKVSVVGNNNIVIQTNRGNKYE